MVLDLALVGTGGMMPLPNRWLASVLVRYGSHLVLFDCGEGTQISLRSLGWGLKDIDLMLISHTHADHIAGLPGLLLTQANSGRTQPVQIVGPPGVARIVDGLRVIAGHLPFEVQCREMRSGEGLDLAGLGVICAAADHHVPCLAYRLDVSRGRRFRPERARALGVPVDNWHLLQRGQAVAGVDPSDVLGPPRRGLAVGLVTDTRPTDSLVELVSGVDLLIAEGMYGDDADQARAVERKHMTFRETATFAARAAAKQLVLSHFSPSVMDPEVFAANARAVFPETIVGHDHLTLTLRFSED